MRPSVIGCLCTLLVGKPMRVGRAREDLDRCRGVGGGGGEGPDRGGLDLRELRELRCDRTEALLALTRSRTEAGVALHLFDVAIAARHAVLEVGERDVLASTEHDLARHY